MARRIPVIGLFSGAGGLEIGALQAGADVRLCVELDAIACQTLRENSLHSGRVLEADVTTLDGRTLRKKAGLSSSQPCFVIGGPPCQPFSKAAYWTDPGDDSRYRRARARGESLPPKPAPITEARQDERRDLVKEFLRLVLEIDAQGFLFENVPSITHPRNKKIIDNLIESADAANYCTRLLRINSAEYGVPQSRHRIVLLGLKNGKPQLPTPTHTEEAGGNLLALPAVTAGEALQPFSNAKFAEPEEVVAGRYAQHLQEIPPGQNYKALTAWAGHPDPAFEAETRFWSFLLKLSPNLPSWTIPANPGPWVGPFHWNSRRLRTVELAALQTFPAGYAFAGNRRQRIRQIGNAVPPLMAQKMMESLISAFSDKPSR